MNLLAMQDRPVQTAIRNNDYVEGRYTMDQATTLPPIKQAAKSVIESDTLEEEGGRFLEHSASVDASPTRFKKDL